MTPRATTNASAKAAPKPAGASSRRSAADCEDDEDHLTAFDGRNLKGGRHSCAVRPVRLRIRRQPPQAVAVALVGHDFVTQGMTPAARRTAFRSQRKPNANSRRPNTRWMAVAEQAKGPGQNDRRQKHGEERDACSDERVAQPKTAPTARITVALQCTQQAMPVALSTSKEITAQSSLPALCYSMPVTERSRRDRSQLPRRTAKAVLAPDTR